MIYLDNAATSYPKPTEVIRAVSGVMEKIGGNPGRGGHAGALAGGRIMEKCRELAAEYAGVSGPEKVIFCLNCTDALNMAIRGTLHAGDEVLVSHAEHNAVLRPLMGYHDAGKITVRMLEPDPRGLLSPDTVRQAIGPKTALMVLCHASNVTGLIQPACAIARTCHDQGVPLLLDAAQTAGTEDIASIHADMIAMPGHKGLLGPMGTGLLCLGDGVLPRPLRAIVAEMDSYAFLRPMAKLFECRCGGGRLLFSTLNLHHLQDHPEARALLGAIYRYMASDEFRPDQVLSPKWVAELVSMPK